MEPFRQGTIDLSFSKKVSSSHLYPCFKQIKDHLNICEADKKFDFVHDAIKIMKSKFEEYWIKILDKALICHKYIKLQLILVQVNRVRLQI
ncbi:hypothetical protein BpHYR1_026035 [Brachionus plicatilis]|uniref:hAT-like transposase RNase-H fold domain-containing protein n=1 Tax=Brachionus plicatilis TaxID=10195 RepID=A0A3M7SYW9_BRAPC|nr:hypothetical protein BpHYR1_026035 [Brachionus plicatilis]